MLSFSLREKDGMKTMPAVFDASKWLVADREAFTDITFSSGRIPAARDGFGSALLAPFSRAAQQVPLYTVD